MKIVPPEPKIIVSMPGELVSWDFTKKKKHTSVLRCKSPEQGEKGGVVEVVLYEMFFYSTVFFLQRSSTEGQKPSKQ